MQKLTLISLLLIFNLTFGQDKSDQTESLIAEFKLEMKKENISNFFMVKHITYGYTILTHKKGDTTPCIPKGHYFNMYGFWKNGNNTWLKKYDNCGGFNAVKLTNSKATDFYKEAIEKLKKEEVEAYIIKRDSIINGKKYSFVSASNHSALRYFWFFQNSVEFTKKLDKYNLETEEDNRNLNYTSNNNLSIATLNLICEEIIYGLEKKKIFKRLK